MASVSSIVWKPAQVDADYSGFDPKVLYAEPSGNISHDVAVLSTLGDPQAPGVSRADINLVTTPLRAFQVSFDLTVPPGQTAAEPLRLGIWSPWAHAGYFLVFTGPEQSIETQAMIHGADSKTLVAGHTMRTKLLGHYATGQRYRVEISVARPRAISVAVFGDALQGVDSVSSLDLPDLFSSIRLAVTASAVSDQNSTTAILENYHLTLPHERLWANKLDDYGERVALVILLILGALLLVIPGMASLRTVARSGVFGRARQSMLGAFRRVRPRGGIGFSLIVATLAYFVGNAVLFRLGGHPFDMGNEKLYAYVAQAYGPTQLYYLPNVVSLAQVWGGTPYVEAAFPYEPIVAYLFSAIGWLSGQFLPGPAALSPSSAQLEYLIKTVNVFFGLADGILIYLILRQIRVSQRWSLIGAALFVFNPAVWFSMSVWGQTHVFSLFFVLLSIWFAEKDIPLAAWLALAAACLTRPQMLVFGFLLGLVFLKTFSWRQNLFAVSRTIIVTFILLSPLTLATSPSLPADIMLNNLRVQEGGANDAALTTVSQDAYSVWPLVTYIAHGASGLQRIFTPSAGFLVGRVGYQNSSQLLSLAAMLFVSGVLLIRKRVKADAGGYLPLVALGMVAFLMFMTGLVATHFLLALPFLLLCRRWIGNTPYLFIVAIWTVTTFVPMFGDMGVAISRLDYPLLSPAHSPITLFFVKLYAWDRFITVGIVANICALIVLAFVALRSARSPTPTQTPVAMTVKAR